MLGLVLIRLLEQLTSSPDRVKLWMTRSLRRIESESWVDSGPSWSLSVCVNFLEPWYAFLFCFSSQHNRIDEHEWRWNEMKFEWYVWDDMCVWWDQWMIPEWLCSKSRRKDRMWSSGSKRHRLWRTSWRVVWKSQLQTLYKYTILNPALPCGDRSTMQLSMSECSRRTIVPHVGIVIDMHSLNYHQHHHFTPPIRFPPSMSETDFHRISLLEVLKRVQPVC